MRKDKAIKFMRKARFVANEFSKDTSTKVGSLLLDPVDYTEFSQGYNGMPRGADESRPERQERPMKYHFYEHAERNNIYNRAREALKGSICVTTEAPGMSCARAIISVGAVEVYFPRPAEVTEEFSIALQLFKECGVQVGYIADGVIEGEPSRHTRKLTDFVRRAQNLAKEAKDPLATGTVFLSPGCYTQLTDGYSGFPRGADDSRTERYYGEERKKWVEGSVRNAIYNVVRAKLKGSVGMVTATTCVECARAFIAIGTSEVVYVEPAPEMAARWADSLGAALGMLEELGVPTMKLTEEEVSNVV